MILRNIPSSGEQLPVIGLGTWSTFDVKNNQANLLLPVLQAMKTAGGTLIDSSPMYGQAEQTVGILTQRPELENDFFYATKVWTSGRQQGIEQMEESLKKMNRQHMDLMQIHNLLDWKNHALTLREWKEKGRIRYTGITHYTDGMHAELERVLQEQHFDFVQFNYSIFSRHAEKRLLDVAAGLGIATIINRPFGEGSSFDKVKHKALPDWATEHGIASWAQFFLLYIASHPAVTVIIPATRNALHAEDNFKALNMELPTAGFRKKMADFVDKI